jgi:Ca2+-binding RTX toxin-like protein
VVSSTATYVLPANVENLRIASTGNANGIGNTLANLIYAGTGNNLINGGSNVDTVTYETHTSGVTVSLAIVGAQATGGSGTDTLYGIERLTGTSFADQLTGDALNNWLHGLDGSDTLAGGDGNDAVWGDGGNDTVGGGNGNDSIYGGDGDDALFGSEGNDLINGGNGIDTAYYNTALSAVSVRLYGLAQDTGGAGIDTVQFVENLVGSAFADYLWGDGNANRLEGGAGNDTLRGYSGPDTLVGGAGADLFDGALGIVGAPVTIVDFQSGIDTIDVSAFDAISGLYNQAFVYIGSDAFTAAGQLRYEGGVVYGNHDEDTDAEFMLVLTGAPPLVAEDFIL